MRLLFLGSPGVGKGTYAQIIEKELKIPHISTGDLLREEAKSGTELGHQLKKVMEQGELVSDELMISLIEKRIGEDDCSSGFILDGFPRTLNQAEELKKLTEISHVLNFKADDEIIIERLSSRIICNKCNAIFNKIGNRPMVENTCDHCESELIQRKDDHPESVRKRLKVYKEKTEPLIDYFKQEGLLVEVIINKNISEIRDKVLDRIQKYLEGEIDTIGEIR